MSDSITELSWTGERYVPQLRGTIALEHLHRYAMATEFVSRKRVLDIASGEGYGSEMLAKRAASVVGVDIDEASINHAQKKYQKENLIFKQGSCTAIPLADHSVDVVVSFETIEHIKEHEKMFEEIKRVLVPGGLLIMSSPEKHEYTEVPKHYNEFHVKELYYDEFEELVKKSFKNYSILGQRVLYGSGIFPLSEKNIFGGIYNFDDLPHQLNKQSVFPRPFYLIAICSDQELPKLESCFCEQDVTETDPHKKINDVLKETKHELLYKEVQAEEQRQQLELQQGQLAEKNFLIHEQELKINQQEEDLVSLKAKIALFTSLEQEEKKPQKEGRTIRDYLSIKFLKQLVDRLRKFCADQEVLTTITKSNLFEEQWYLQQNPDVASSGMDALWHYIAFGDKEGRDPHSLFHTRWYLNSNPDLRTAGVNLFWHYLKYGWKEGRRPNQFFDTQWYLQQNKDVAVSGREPLTHYYKMGWKEKRSPHPLFDLAWYLDQHPELLVANEDPLSHYINDQKNKNQSIVKSSLVSSSLVAFVSKKYNPKISLELEKINKYLFAAITKEAQTYNALEALKEEIKKSSFALPVKKYTVSIIIPVHNQLAFTLACVATILKSEIKGNFEILIADDASMDATATTFEGLHPSIKLIHQSSNLGFLRNCNETAKQAQGDYILFLNNDTLVLPGWLDALVDIFNTRPDAGLVGAKLLNADGTLQEAGGIIWKDGSAWNYGRNDDPEKSEYNYVRETDYSSGACLMISKKLWEELEGFDLLFSPAYCEDSDLAFRVRAAGKKVYYQPKCEVIHLEGKSHGRDVKQGIKAYQVENNKKLFQRWKNVLAVHAAPGKDVFKQRDRALQKKTILIIDHHLPQYDRDAGARTIWSYIKFFVQKGFVVKFLGDVFLSSNPYYTELQQMGVEVLYNGPQNQHWKKWLKKNGKHIDYVFLSRAHIAVKYVRTLKKQTNAKLLFYGHDLLSRTFSNNSHFLSKVLSLTKSKKWEKLENEIINQVDVTYYPSYVEVDYLQKVYPNKVIKLLPPYVLPPRENKSLKEHAFHGKLLFVGGFNHPPNVEAMLWFVKKIWPSVLSLFPEVQLTIAGSHPPKEIFELANDHVHVTGFISDQELVELYQEHDIAIVPLLTGGGIKNKVIEALWHGKPVLTTPIGAEGIPNIQEYVKVAAPEDFFESLKNLIETPSLLKTFANNASQLIGKYYSEEALYSVLSEDIDFS